MEYAQNKYNGKIKKQILGLIKKYSSLEKTPPQKIQLVFGAEKKIEPKPECEIMSLWFLIDGVMLESNELAQLAKTAKYSKSLLSNTQYNIDDEDVGPWLMQAPDNEAEQAPWLINLIACCSGLPALSIIISQHNIEEIEATLTNLITAHTTDKQIFYCRFADARVIPVLTKTLTKTQINTTLGTIKHWYYVNRSGNFEAAIYIASDTCKEKSLDPYALYSPSPLLLNEQQFDNMLEASEVDNMFGLLCDMSADLIPENARGIFYARLERILKLAKVKSINDISDQLQFIILALTYGDNFYQHKMLQDTWNKINNQSAKFGKLAEDWPDEIWQALEDEQVSA